jgi:hypothetical protein
MAITRVGVRPRAIQVLFPLAIALLILPLSAWLTIELCRELLGPIGALAGLSLEALKSYGGIEMWRHRFSLPRGVGWSLVAMATIGVSVVASLGAFASQAQARRTGALRESPEYQATAQQLQSIERQIATLEVAASADVAASFRTRTIRETYPRLAELGRQREALTGRLTRFESDPVQVVRSDFFVALGRLLRRDDGTVQLIGCLVVAVILELGGILVCDQLRQMLGSGVFACPRTGTSKDEPRGNGRRDTGVSEGSDTRYAEIREAVRSRQVRPVVAAVARAASARKSTAQRYLEALAAEGLLRKAKQGRYELAEGVG